MNRLAASSRIEATRILATRRIGGDVLTGATKLSADTPSHMFQRVLEEGRKKNFVTCNALCVEAGISPSWYRVLQRDPGRGSPRVWANLMDALRRLCSVRHLPDDSRQLEWHRGLYGTWLAAVCPHFGTTPAAVHAADPRRCATGNADYLNASRARQTAIYLAHTSSGIPQRALGRAVGISDPAVCQAIKKIEGRRDREPGFDRLLDRVSAEVMGRLVP